MIVGADKSGTSIFYVDNDGTRLKGDCFSVGSGSTFAYGVLDQGYRWDLTDDEAKELGRRSIYAAGHRDAFSGNTVNLYHVKPEGWEFIRNYDFSECRLPVQKAGAVADLLPMCPRRAALRVRVRLRGTDRTARKGGRGGQARGCPGRGCSGMRGSTPIVEALLPG